MHPAEQDRLDSLASYAVLDTPPEAAFDGITALAASACDAPIAIVTLLDRDRAWFKSAYGTDVHWAPREHTFCTDAVAGCSPLIVPDATRDADYHDNPYVTSAPGIRAYAGVPLVGRDGLPIGTLCVLDVRPRRFSPSQIHTLTGLAAQVVALLEQRRRDATDGLSSVEVLGQARDPVRLRRALDDGEFIAHYQPMVDMSSGVGYGMEALLRWEHPALGTLTPAAFLAAIESSALIVPVGRAMLDAALGQVAALRQRKVPLPGGVAVNVASGQLARPGLARDVFAALDRHHVEPSQLAVEITEATALPDPALALAELTELSAAGVHVAIDDFGVGWSNLERLLTLPMVTALKLDRSLASAVLSDGRAAAMVDSTMALAERLGLAVIAEGVETEAVRHRLVDAGCAWGQGWLFSAAVPGVSLPHLLRRLSAAANAQSNARSALPHWAAGST